MCTTAFHSGIVCHVPHSFPEIFRRKTSRKLKKTRKNKKTSRGIGKQKSAKPKKPRENKKNNIPEVLGRGGGQTRVSKYCFFFFFLFSRGFFGFALFCFPRPLENCVFLIVFLFFWFSRGFCTFSKGPSPKILKMSFLICSSRLYFSFVYCYAFFGRNLALMLLFFISCVAFHI